MKTVIMVLGSTVLGTLVIALSKLIDIDPVNLAIGMISYLTIDYYWNKDK